MFTVKGATHPAARRARQHNWNRAESILNKLNLVNKRFFNTDLDLKLHKTAQKGGAGVLHIAQKAKFDNYLFLLQMLE